MRYFSFNATAPLYNFVKVEVNTRPIFASINVDSFHCFFDNLSPSWSNREANRSPGTCTI